MNPRVLLLALLIPGLTGCSNDTRQRLVIYSPHGKEMLGEFERAFEAVYPEIDVRWIDMGGQDVYDRVRTEAVNPQASVWWGGDSPTFSKASAEGLLAPYRPSWADSVPAGAYGSDHGWYATYRTPEVILFNTRTVPEGERPLDWDDLLAPEWEDRIIIRYPLASSTMRTIWGALIMRQPTVEEGFAWLARLDMNTKTYTADPTQLYLKIAREEGDVSLWNLPDTQIQSQLNNYPFGFSLPTSGTPILNDCIALVRGGPAQEAARDFYEFVTSDSALVRQAEAYFRIPVREDIAADRLPEWMARPLTAMEVDWGRLERDGASWMQHWDERIKGRGADYLEDLGL